MNLTSIKKWPIKMYPYAIPKLEQEKSICEDGKALCAPVVRFGRDFCMETGIHGFRHIAEPGRHWFERLLWAVVTGLACWGAVDVSLGQLQRYNDNPTVVTLEKDFRAWRFSLPAVTVCMKNRVDPAKLPEVIKEYWDVDTTDKNYEYYSRFVHTVANSNLLSLNGYLDFEDEELDVDLYQLVVDVVPNEDIKTLSSEKNAHFKWTPVMTENGVCYSTNSLAIDDVAIVKTDLNDTKMFPVTCKYAAASCLIMLEVFNVSYYYVHSPYDVLDITTSPSTVLIGVQKHLEMSVIETGCGKGVKELSLRRRGCLYTDEPVEKGKQVYSTNACRLACRSQVAMAQCGCKPFYYFYEDGPQCTTSGMACLAGKAQELASIAGVHCSCTPQCMHSFFREIAWSDLVWENGPFSNKGYVKYTIQAPRTRYTREIVFHFQDLVVSFGGATGLFLGASFISFVEIIYFVLARCFTAVSRTHERHTMIEKPMSFEQQQIAGITTILGQNNHDLKLTNNFFK